MIEIFRRVGDASKVVCTVSEDGASTKQAIMGIDEVVINVTVDSVIDVTVGDYIMVDGIAYELNRDPEFTQKSELEHEYSFTFEHPLYRLLDKIYIYKITKKATFTLTGRLSDFVSLLAWNMNKTEDNPEGVDTGWTVGNIVVTDYKTLVFSNMSCRDVLTKLASDFGVEFFLKNKLINYISHIENETGLVFEQGKGKGLYSISQKNVDTENAVTRVYPIGGTQNVTAKYADIDGHLILPEIYIENFSEYHKVVEKGVEFSNIYPSFIGAITSVSGENNSVVKCTDIDFNIKEVAVGDEARINFLSGDLMGKSFSFQWNNETKEITLIEQEDDTALADETGKKPIIPSPLKLAKLGDEFNFTGLYLPESYNINAITKLRKAATDWLDYYCRKRIKFELRIDHRYLRGKRSIMPGDLVTIRVPKHKIDKVIRVTSVDKKLRTGELTCIVSNYLDEKWEKRIEGQISNIQQNISGGGGTGGGFTFDVLERYDGRTPTDKNVFSSLRTLVEINNVVLKLNEKFIRKDIPDTAHCLITFEAGLCTPGFVDGFTEKAAGLKMYSDGSLTTMKLLTRKEALFGKSVASPNFTSGFPNGTGWMIAPYKRMNAAGVEETKYKLEIDDLTVRNNFRVFEMIISQLVGENDNRIFSGQMEVDHIDTDTSTIYLKTGDGILYNTFRRDDILMVQRFGGLPTAENGYNVIKLYELRVTESGIGNLGDKDKRLDYIRYSNFVGDLADVAEGDVLTRADNLTNPTRKGLMKIVTIDEFGTPYQDVIYGMKTDPVNCTKVRLGNLGGLVTPYWGQLEGWGFMAVNAYLKGRFMLHTGEDVLTKFEITEGLIRSEISAIRTEISEKYNYLSNGSFSDNTDKWEAVSNIRLFTVSARFLYFNENFYSDKQRVAAVVEEGDRRALRIKKTGVRQLNTNLAKKPILELEKPEGEKVWPTFYLTFKYKCVKKGTLKIGFPNKDLFFTEVLSETEIYLTKEYSAPWDGTGDFTIDFTGDIYIYSLSLTDNPLENYKIETATRFYQTDYRIGLWAEKTDKIAGTVTTLGLDLDALEGKVLLYANKTDSINNTVLNLGISLDATKEKLSLYANKTDNLSGTVRQLGIDLDTVSGQLSLYVKDSDLSGYELVSRINLAPSWIQISSKNINLQGAVTFSSLKDDLYSTINGKVNTSALGGMAYYDKVKDAMTKESVLIGGYFNTTLIKVEELWAKQATIGRFKIADGKLDWTGQGDNASIALGYNSWFGASCIAVRAAFWGNGITAISDNGGAALFGSMYSSPSYPNTSYLYACYLDGDLVMTRGNIIVRSGGASGKGVIQADQMLPQNGWSGSFKGKSVEVKNGIITNVW